MPELLHPSRRASAASCRTLPKMEQAALRIMEAIGVQVLVIDEVHNITCRILSRAAASFLNTLRFLSNRLQDLACLLRRQRGAGGDQRRRSNLRAGLKQFTLSRWAAKRTFPRRWWPRSCATRRLRRRSVLTPEIASPESLQSRWYHGKHLPCSTTWPSEPSKRPRGHQTTSIETGSQVRTEGGAFA